MQLYLCLTLFFRVRTSDDDSFTSEEAKKFICGLENHFYEIFNIKLGVSKQIQTSYTVTFCWANQSLDKDKNWLFLFERTGFLEGKVHVTQERGYLERIQLT